MNSNILLTLLLLTMVRAASKYYDGPIRPYEFGFNIEGHQHRKESKDKNGIIMGEFGFITADNVYHVTVYATDEDGNFKIVSMKNYKLGPPTAPPPAVPAPTRPTTKATPTRASTSTTPQPFRIITTVKSVEPLTTPKPSNVASCSGCKIPTPPRTTTTQAPEPEASTQYVPPFKIVNKNDLEADGKPIATTTTTTTTTMMAITTTPQSPGSSKEVPQKLIEKAPPVTKKERPGSSAGGGTSNTTENNQANREKPASNQRQPPPPAERGETPKGMQRPATDRVNDDSPQLNEDSRRPAGGDPVMKLVELHTANMIQHILNGLLYRFNYTAGYHGHHEQGDRQGNKEGGYFAVGRDGIRRGVSYKANEFGFQPHVKFEKVSPEETPREETEKQAGLKGFDFKWFYGS